MTNFCPNCGKKADEDEKRCSVCGEEIASLSQDSESKKGKNKIDIKIKLLTLVAIVCIGFFGFNIISRYFNAGKNIENTANSQKSELKILKRPSQTSYEDSDEDDIVKKESSSDKTKENEEENEQSTIESHSIEEKEISEKKSSHVLQKKERYLKIMSELNQEVKEMADSELNGDEERLLNYTSKIYKKYDTVLNVIYSDITSSLENEELEKLKQDENEWIKTKEEMASSSVGSEDTSESDENWVYFDSLATSTKDRCYYLIHHYMY